MAPTGGSGRRGRKPRAPEVALSSAGTHPKDARVRYRREFVRIQGHGKRVHTPAFTIVASPGIDTARARLGCAVSKRVGNAVVRNRIRRLLREVFRRSAAELPAIDLVIIAKPNAAELAKSGLAAVAAMVQPALHEAAKRVGPISSGGIG
jgi:ribonuclease P protein component